MKINWIETEERLPDTSNWYLVTIEIGRVEIMTFEDVSKKFVSGYYYRNDVIAWAELPDPFKK